MILTALGFIAKLGIGPIALQLAEAFKARENAKTDAAKIAADERIAGLRARAKLQAEEPAFGLNTIVRACYGLPPAIYLGKIFIYDKVLGLGTTDSLSPELWQVTMVAIGFYFVSDTARRVWRR